MRVGVITFPGTLDDRDAARAVVVGGAEAVSLWHGDADLKSVDAVVLPGGFSYGDYLRCGAISRFAPVMQLVIEAANKGMPVLGICNQTAWTNSFQQGEKIVIPLKNGEGSFQCDEQTLAMLEGEGRVIARYVGENPNGSRNLIAGITNAKGNVVGLMPHPEHAINELTGPSAQGLGFFTSILNAMVK